MSPKPSHVDSQDMLGHRPVLWSPGFPFPLSLRSPPGLLLCWKSLPRLPPACLLYCHPTLRCDTLATGCMGSPRPRQFSRPAGTPRFHSVLTAPGHGVRSHGFRAQPPLHPPRQRPGPPPTTSVCRLPISSALDPAPYVKLIC